MLLILQRATPILVVVSLLAGCSGGNDTLGGSGQETGGQNGPDTISDSGVPNDGEQDGPNVSEILMAPAGDITHYGALSVADDVGVASDLVASFYQLDSGVSSEFLSSMFSGESAMCQVQDDGVIDFEEISAGFVPSIPGIRTRPVSAGQAIVLTDVSGTYATLEERPAAGFIFYDLANPSMLPEGSVPQGLRVSVEGSADIPQITAALVPDITTLSAANPSATDNIAVGTQFTWEPSDDQTAMIRIFSSTAGGFFLEDGVTVTCVVPDTGSFRFPAATQALLGDDFNGSPALMSRIVVNPVQTGSSLFYVIRESFR